MGLSLALQNQHDVPQWRHHGFPSRLQTLRTGGPVSSALNLPYYTAAGTTNNSTNYKARISRGTPTG